MNLDSSALVVVDVQNGFLTAGTAHVLPVIVRLSDRWLKAGGRALYSRYFNYAGSAFERLTNWRQIYASPDTDLAEKLAVQARHSMTFDKGTYTAFTREFTELISAHGWTDLVICGIDTDLCVLKTAFDAFEKGLTPWVVTDASASTGGPAVHEAGLLILGRGIGEHHLVTTEELFSRVLGLPTSSPNV